MATISDGSTTLYSSGEVSFSASATQVAMYGATGSADYTINYTISFGFSGGFDYSTFDALRNSPVATEYLESAQSSANLLAMKRANHNANQMVGRMEWIDITDFIPTKGGAKIVVSKAMAFLVIRKGVTEVVSDKAMRIFMGLPSKIKSSVDGFIDISKFTKKNMNNLYGPNGYYLSKTKGTPHGDGAVWKLFDSNGARVATIDESGKVLRK